MPGDPLDLIIVGAGPVGLYGLYTARMRKASAVVLDSLPEPGGQVTVLYPSKWIYDVAGFPQVLGRDLIKALVDQAAPEPGQIRCSERAVDLFPSEDGLFHVTTEKASYVARAVILTVGIGAFAPRRLRVPGAQELEGHGVHYRVDNPEDLRDRRVLVVGGGDSALDWALAVEPLARSLTLIHMLEEFEAHEDSVEKLGASRARVLTPWELTEVMDDGTGRVERARIRRRGTGEEEILEVDDILIFIGQVANLGSVKEWGVGVKGNSIPVNTRMQTVLPGVYAAGDVAAYDGKIDLIATGFGEVATAVNNAMTRVRPGAKAAPGHSTKRGF